MSSPGHVLESASVSKGDSVRRVRWAWLVVVGCVVILSSATAARFAIELGATDARRALGVASVVELVVLVSMATLVALLVRHENVGEWARVLGAIVAIGGVGFVSEQGHFLRAAESSVGDAKIRHEAFHASEWGVSRPAFAMHPADGFPNRVDRIRIWVPKRASSATVSVTKPLDTLRAPDGSRTQSDGVELEIRAVGADGDVHFLSKTRVDPERVFSEHWIDTLVPLPDDSRELELTITPGPSGSNTHHDSSLVSISVASSLDRLAALGRVAAPTGAVMMLIFAIASIGKRLSSEASWAERWSTLRKRVSAHRREWWWPMTYAAVLVAGVAVYVANSETIVCFDPTINWGKTDRLSSLLATGAIGTAFRAVAESIGEPHTLLPTIVPAALSVFARKHDFLNYLLALALGYVIPASLVIGWVSERIARQVSPAVDAEASRNRLPNVVIGALGCFAAAPHFLYVFLTGMLDMGGVLIAVALVFAWIGFLDVLTSDVADSRRRDTKLMAAAIAVVALLVLLSLFRRWFVFFAFGTTLTAAFLAGWAIVASRLSRRVMVRRLAIAASTAILLLVALLSGVAIEWMLDWKHRQFAESHAAFWRGWEDVPLVFRGYLGFAVPAVVLAFSAYVFARSADRRLMALLFGGSVLAFACIYFVQSPTENHFYLMMPLVGSTLGAIAILAAHRFGRLVTVIGLAILFVFTGFGPRATPLALARPSQITLVPPTRSDLPELVRLGNWLAGSLGPGQKYCVVSSSSTLNWVMMSHLWELDRDFLSSLPADRIQFVPDVDTRDGPPTAGLKNCAFVLVADPIQTEVGRKDQQAIALPAADLLNGTGIGKAFRKLDQKFLLQNDVSVMIFAPIRPLEDSEVADLRRRFFATKGSAAARYIERFGP